MAKDRQQHWLVCALVWGCFALVFTALTIGSSLQKSPTFDESYHLFAGYSHLTRGDFRIYPEHPPLAKILAALPLLALDVKYPRLSGSDRTPDNWWLRAHHMVFQGNDAEPLFFYARLPMIALGLLLGVVVYLWAKELYGAVAAIAALFLFCLDPNTLAHTPILHTDIPFTTFFFISTYFLWRTWVRLTWLNLFLVSLFFGLGVITKDSFLVIPTIWGTLGLLIVFSSQPLRSAITRPEIVHGRWEKTILLMVILGSAVITAYLFVWAAYGFRFDAGPEGQDHLSLAYVTAGKPLLQKLASFSAQNQLFPEAWTYGLLYVLKFLNRPAYLMGHVSEDGFWLYFPVVFAVKTPLPMLLLLLATLGIWLLRRRTRMPDFFLLIPVVIYFSFAVWSRMNIGLRHLLPIYPFLFVLAGGTAVELWASGRRSLRLGLLFLGLWYLWSSVNIYPHYLAFFNEFAGGAKNGYKVLADSSLDWGQDLKGLKRWMDQNGVKKIRLAYFGTADPIYYGIDAVYMPGSLIFSPRPESKNPEAPRYIAVSATYIYGVDSGKPLKEFYKPLRFRKPVATIGHSIFIYRLDSG